MDSPYRFFFVAHSQEVADRVVSVAQRDPSVELEAYVATSESLIRIAQQKLETGTEIILCHGGTGSSLVRAFRTAAVPINRTDMEIIKTLQQAKTFSRDIGIVTFPDDNLDLKAMEALLDIRLHELHYVSWDQQVANVDALYAQGGRVVAGGGTSTQRMKALGGIGLLILPSDHSIQQALLQAKRIAQQKRMDARHLQEVQTLFGHLRDAVVSVDNACRCLFANSMAKQLLDLKDGNDSAWSAAAEALLFREVLVDRKPRREEIVTFKKQQFVVNVTPLLTESGMSGAVAVFSDALSVQNMNRKITEKRFNQSLISRYTVNDVRGDSPEMVRLRELIKRFAPTDAAVHISGETGTGKERVAHALHAAGSRQKGPFVAVNISALPENLMESELFGYEEGSFTGARRNGKPGLFELAHKGTLFLDEVGDLSLPLQLRLLRVLESKEVMRIGASGFIPVDVRIISATHHKLMDLVRQGRFRMDLYFRLTTLTLDVPPLRDRIKDIPLLCKDVLQQHGLPHNYLSKDMLEALSSYQWPGNVRELLALIERYCILNDFRKADAGLMKDLVRQQRNMMSNEEKTCRSASSKTTALSEGVSLKKELDRVRRELISEFISRNGGDRKLAARELGISYTTLWREMREWDKN